MSQTIDVNGQSINYPETGDTNWGDEATDFAVQTSAAFGKLGLASGTSVDIAQTLDVTGNTTLDANLSVGGDSTLTGNLTVNGNTLLGNANTDTIGVTGIVNVDSGTLYVDPVNNRVGINDTTPSQALDVTGNVAISGNETVGGVLYVDDNTTANTPVISFTGDTNTGFGRSGADTLDFITNGASRFRIEATGQIKAVYESQVGTDYNTQLDNGYLCRAWVNFIGTGTVAIRASGNVTSITDNGAGDYTVNFTTAMPDANYSFSLSCQRTANGSIAADNIIPVIPNGFNVITPSNIRVRAYNSSGISLFDTDIYTVAVFR